jgi:hypothetical protein
MPAPASSACGWRDQRPHSADAMVKVSGARPDPLPEPAGRHRKASSWNCLSAELPTGPGRRSSRGAARTRRGSTAARSLERKDFARGAHAPLVVSCHSQWNRAYSPSWVTSAPHTRHARSIPSGRMSKISKWFVSEPDDVGSLMRPAPVAGSLRARRGLPEPVHNLIANRRDRPGTTPPVRPHIHLRPYPPRRAMSNAPGPRPSRGGVGRGRRDMTDSHWTCTQGTPLQSDDGVFRRGAKVLRPATGSLGFKSGS